MTRRQYDGEERKPWPWWQRVPIRVGNWFYHFFIGPFLTKLPDGTVMGSMTRFSVFLFTIAEVLRLAPIWVHTPSGWIVTMAPLGFPDVLAIFFILYALAIDNALNNSKPKDVTDLIGKILPGGGSASVSQTQTASVTPIEPEHDA